MLFSFYYGIIMYVIKERIKPVSTFTIRFYLDSTDKSIPDFFWELENQYDEIEMMFYVDFDGCTILEPNDCENVFEIDKKNHKGNQIFLNFLCCNEDMDRLIATLSIEKYSVQDLVEIKSKFTELLLKNDGFLVND